MNQGFTIIEFVVIISIFAIVAGIALFNFSGFSTNISLNNLAHEIALVMRQAQTFGASSTQTPYGVAGSPTRGVAFPVDGTGAYGSTFTIFADNQPDLVFTNATDDTVVDRVTVQSDDKIRAVYVGDGIAAPRACADGLYVTFTRPNTDASMICGVTSSQPEGYARIEIESADASRELGIEIWSTGQISIVDL